MSGEVASLNWSLSRRTTAHPPPAPRCCVPHGPLLAFESINSYWNVLLNFRSFSGQTCSVQTEAQRSTGVCSLDNNLILYSSGHLWRFCWASIALIDDWRVCLLSASEVFPQKASPAGAKKKRTTLIVTTSCSERYRGGWTAMVTNNLTWRLLPTATAFAVTYSSPAELAKPLRGRINQRWASLGSMEGPACPAVEALSPVLTAKHSRPKPSKYNPACVSLRRRARWLSIAFPSSSVRYF